MVIGTENVDAILKSSSTLQCIAKVFECGLLESKDHLWLVASPDGFALFNLPGSLGTEGDQLHRHFGSLEIKTRVAPDRIAKA